MIKKRHKYKTEDIISAIKQHDGVLAHAARSLGVQPRTFCNWVKDENLLAESKKTDFKLTDLPDDDISVDDIFAYKEKRYKKLKAYKDASVLRDVHVKREGVIGIAHFGDPHLDDDGCDTRLFREHVDIVKNTDGLYAGNVGDLTNNWVGRLQAKYADQSTTQAQAWKLIEWMFSEIPWLYVLAGNHDCWYGGHDPVTWISKHLNQPYIPHGVRLRLKFPKGRDTIIYAAHDFPGHSMWNTSHGATKKAWTHPDDEILVCGHKHHTGYAIHPHPVSGKVQHMIRCDSYKVIDEYADKLLIDQSFVAPCPITVIDPEEKKSAKRIKVFLDTQEGADYLTWRRKRDKA